MPSSIEALVQRQLEAYNRHDLEQFLACYSPEVEVRTFPEQTLLMTGRGEMRERYASLFERGTVQAELLQRMTLGDVAIDYERVEGLEDQPGHVDAVAMYHVEGDFIRRVWFIKP